MTAGRPSFSVPTQVEHEFGKQERNRSMNLMKSDRPSSGSTTKSCCERYGCSDSRSGEWTWVRLPGAHLDGGRTGTWTAFVIP